MSELIDTTEMYLRTLYELLEEGIDLRRARIVDRLLQSGPTVSQTVSRMERDGLVVLHRDRSLGLTQTGHDRAQAVMRRHRLVECLLTEVIGLDRVDVHDEACRWEHVISPQVEQRLDIILGHPRVSPFGNAIPYAHGQMPSDSAQHFRDDSEPLTSFLEGRTGPVRFRLVRMSEFFQATEPNLAMAERVGMLPGDVMAASRDDDAIAVRTTTGEVRFPEADAEGLFVTGADDQR